MTSDNTSTTTIRLVESNDAAAEVNSPKKRRKNSMEATVCGRCFGTGVEVVPGKGARPCDCRTQYSLGKLLEAARIPIRYKDCTFDNFDKHNAVWRAIGEAQKLIDEYPDKGRSKGQGLLFMGPVGVGKTHLSIAILRGLIEFYGITGLFYQFGSLLKEIQNSYNPISQTSELEVLAPVFEAEVLVLDELGASIPTDWVRESMYQIINKRYNDKKLTIFTTNFLDDPRTEQDARQDEGTDSRDEAAPRRRTPGKLTVDMRARHSATQTLEDRIGTRLRSRLYEMCNKVLIEGDDYRKYLDKRRFDSTRI